VKENIMRAIHLISYGNPVDGLQLVDIAEPVGPGKNEVLVGVEYAPINPNDLMLAQGIYAKKPALPTVLGNEGVGGVLKVGSGVSNVRVGDRVVLPLSSFTWRERMVIPSAGLFALPREADPRQLAMLGINPVTAWLLLDEYVPLKPGDWILQNAANSGVGRWVIGLCKSRGVKTVNIVRRRELVDELKGIGADAVIVDSPDAASEVKQAVGNAEVRFALDGVSGPATGVLASALSSNGTLVMYAAMSEAAISMHPLDLVFKALTVKGFFMGHAEHAAKFPVALKEAAGMIASGQVRIPVAATYPLAEIKQAVAHSQRGGKVLLEVAGANA
jgi:NADPH:quinone reductase-like Zn-dependent oxidoreductase